MLKTFWKHPWTVAAGNILVLMVVYTLTRVFCYAVNTGMFPGVGFAHLMEMLVGGMRFDLTAILYLSSLYLVMMLLPMPQRIRTKASYQRTARWLLWVPNTLGLLVNTADIAYIPFSDRRTTCTFFSEFSHDSNLLQILGQGILDYWYVALFAIAACTSFILLTRREAELGKPRGKWHQAWYYIRETLLFAGSVYMIVIGIRGGFGRYTRPITLSNALQYTDTPRESALVLNTPFSLMKSLENETYVDPQYYAEDELAQHMNPVHAPHTGPARTDNVVVLILESFSQEYIGYYNHDLDSGTYQGYTPFLDSLLAHSVTYRYSYASGRKSIDAMPSVLSSLPMLIEPYIVTPYATNSVSSLAERLRLKGYESAFYHGAPNGSMGFQAYARSAGFAHYRGKTEYEAWADEQTDRAYRDAFDGTWAIWDEEFLQYYAQDMSQLQEPFVTAVFTASSHHPFRVPKRYEGLFPEGTQVIHAPVGYSDYALRRFFETARKQPWYKHTLFVLTADHTNMPTHAEYSNARGLYAVPIAFYHPAWTKGEMRCNGAVSQTDILPSVLGYLGYDRPSFGFGEDALTQTKPHPYAVCYNAPVYQILSDSLLLQWDGEQVHAVYDYRRDPLLKHNIADSIPAQRIEPMTDYLKGYIQQYIHRMLTDQLTAE
ncbi:MAG: LTA synthase family protein [Paludibacteraceae bacterium]|nr:LTA synthase family protein [Paludibacteraceae bacterium]